MPATISAALAPPDEESRCPFLIARGKPRAMVRRVRRPYGKKLWVRILRSSR
ncbi:MAG: hypothetical protein JNJ88_07580 [Planctomycetes bacterium]|nr:hypothetical protein [Planctomycetota bacterium]